ncbi:hypothetical protein IRZ71_23145 [Flavobacterium sp. ANB]|uniref:hypothetical protein n=1 Tax=unclassified Flavobacterium TaxID=196869 RepID=UPI0012B963F5|nr:MULTISPECIES: hypothetical protein [unclassified Flavobacterium]MBF4519255.1 hypothetical protein [Flavobacterium sp. ANB]MTD71941.1 hypothetical protein [Flavobacterium sp. LC2016-13]
MIHRFKITIVIFFLVLIYPNLFAQEKKELDNVKTKMELFSSKTGTITKFTDTKLPNLKTAYSIAETKIRKISSGAISVYFYQITKEGKYGSTTASIEYNDLIELIKALKALQPETDKDVALNPDYLENKFVTVDGFQIGYYVSGGKANWYIKLEKGGSDNTLFLNNGDLIETAFNEAKIKIEELKK